MEDAVNASVAPSVKTHLEHQLYFVMDGIVCPIVCVAGMVGNLLSLIVWTRPKMTNSTGRYLTAQAIADFAVLFLFLFCDSLKIWSPEVLKSTQYAGFYAYFAYPAYYLAVICSIWYTVGVTLDRFVLVCWISKSKEFCTLKIANYGIAIITLCAFVTNVPHFFYYKPSPAHLLPSKALTKTAFIKGSGGRFYDFWINCITLKVVPWVVVFFMNFKIIKTINTSKESVQASKTNTKSMRKRKQAEVQITRLLLAVTFSFLFFIGAHCIVQAILVQKPDNVNMDRVREAYAVARSLIILNSAMNFVFYCLSGKRFRKELKRMLGMKSKDRAQSALIDSSAVSTTSSHTASTISSSGI